MRKNFTAFWLPLLCLFVYDASSANNPQDLVNNSKNQGWYFFQNKGQLADGAEKASYYGSSVVNGKQEANVYCKPGKITFVFAKTIKSAAQVSEASGKAGKNADDAPDQIRTERTDLVLAHANLNAEIIASDAEAYYENFYTGHGDNNEITHVSAYKTITYIDIYPHIDLVLHSRANGMKYEFVVYPGGNVNSISIKWEGLAKIGRDGQNGLAYTLASGVQGMSESNPVTLQNNQTVKSSFSLAHDMSGRDLIGFNVQHYDHAQTLVIDPVLDWGTYFGGSGGTTYAWATTTDSLGNIYLSGSTTASTGISTTGAFQSTYGGSTDIFLAKFNSAGKEQWATYYGLKGTETAHSVAVGTGGNVFITGATTSLNSIATSGAYLTKNTSREAFLVQFSSSGTRNWGTYFGGGGESSVCVATDKGGNAYIYGETTSKTNVASSGGYQTAYGGGPNDVFLAKFANSGTFKWSTYFGGFGIDDPGNIAADDSGNVFITGYSTSSNAVFTSGAYQTTMLGGGTDGDAFLARFNTNGNLVWSTYFGGEGDDQGLGITLDPFNNVYITGMTNSYTSIATSGAFLTSNQGDEDAFLAKFTKTGSLLYATYYGGLGQDFATFAASDPNGNVYITGPTGSTSGMATKGSYQSSLPTGDNAMFLVRFNKSGTPVYGTYYDFTDVAETLSVATHGYTDVYVTGNSTSTAGIATSGGFLTALAGTEDGYLLHFDFNYNNDAGIDSILSPSSAVCSGPGNMEVKLKNFGSLVLDSVKINWSLNHKTQTPYTWKGHLKTDSTVLVTLPAFNFTKGTDTLQIWTSLPNGIIDSVPVNDSSRSVFIVNQTPAAYTGANAQKCFGATADSLGTAAVSGDTYSWTSLPVGLSSIASKVGVSPDTTTQYILTEKTTATGCTKTDTATIQVNPLPTNHAGPKQTICLGKLAIIGDSTRRAGSTFSWTSAPAGYTSALASPSVSPSKSTIYIFTETNHSGCSKTDSVAVNVNPLPAAIAGHDTALCQGTTIILGAKADSANTYTWVSRPAGFSSATSNPNVTATASSEYVLTETNQFGCSKSDSLRIQANPLPQVHVLKDTSVCAGTALSLGSAAVGGTSYAWTSTPGGYTSSISNPSASPVATTTYKVLEIDSFGCKDSGTTTVTSFPKPHAKFVLSYTGDSAQLAADTSLSGSVYSWNFGDGDSTTGYSVLHLFPKNKNYSISLKVTSKNGCVSDVDSTVNIELSGVVATLPNGNDIHVFPNPFTSGLAMQYNLAQASRVSIALFDVTGKQIAAIQNQTEPAGSHTATFDTAPYNLNAGIYLLQFKSDNEVITVRLEKF